MFRLEIISGSLQISFNGEIILVSPKESCAIDVLTLYANIPFVNIYNKYLGTGTVIFTKPLSDCEDDTGTPFSVNSFIAFSETNLGFYTGSSAVPDATPTVKGIAKLYASLGSNTDGAVDQNTVNTALNLKANVQNTEQIFDAKGYGNWGQANNSTAEEVLRVIDVDGGDYTPTDSMSLLIRLQKGSNTGNMTLRVRVGINGNTSDNLILTTTVAAGANSQSILMQRNQIVFDASNLYIASTTQSINTDITSGTYGTYSAVSLNIANNWKITITCQTDSNTQNIILRHYKITKFKNT